MTTELDRLKIRLAECEKAYSHNDPAGVIPWVKVIRQRIERLEADRPDIESSELLRELDTPELTALTKEFQSRFNSWCIKELDALKLTIVRVDSVGLQDNLKAELDDFKNALFSQDAITGVTSTSELIKTLDDKFQRLHPLLDQHTQKLKEELAQVTLRTRERDKEIAALKWQFRSRNLRLSLFLALGTVIGDMLAPKFFPSAVISPAASALKFVIVFVVAFFGYEIYSKLAVNRAFARAKKTVKASLEGSGPSDAS